MTDSFTSKSPSTFFTRFISFTFIVALLSFPMGLKSQDLIITGLFDGPLTGGTPKAIEFYVTGNIADLSLYGMGKAINGGGSNGQEYTFPAVPAMMGDYLYLATDSVMFNAYFGFDPHFNDSFIPNNNGDDAVELYFNGLVADRFGDLLNDGTGTLWEYLDGWAYRRSGTGPDGTNFYVNNWNYSGTNVTDGETTNASSSVPFPLGTYSTAGFPALSFSALNYTIAEDGGSVDVPVELSLSDNCTVDVTLGTNSTADAADFSVSLPQTLTFTATSPTTTVVQTLNFPIVDDMTIEADETVVLKLSNITGGCLIGTTDSTTILIEDNDTPPEPNNLVIAGVLDGPLTGGTKAVELFATGDILDLSTYGLGSANNGDGSDGEEFTFPAVSVDSGTCIIVTEDAVNFQAFMGFAADYEEGTASNVNGDDAIELFHDGVVVDIFGEIFVDGTGQPWEYLDGWVYRKNGTGPDGSTFVLTNWLYSGINVLDGETTNASAAVPYPNCTYSPMAPANPEFSFASPASSIAEDGGSQTVSVLVSEASNCEVDVAIGFASSATAGVDFTLSSPVTLTFSSAGPTNMDFSIPIIDDGDVEGDETIILVLQNPVGEGGCVIGTPDQMTITIEDNDVAVVNIVDIHGEEIDGSATSDGALVQITGVVHCIDLDNNEGYDFYVHDGTGGINVFEFVDIDAYQATEGDEITITGTVDQFRGLTEIRPATIVMNSAGNALTPHVVVTALDESTESIPVTLNNVSLVDAAAWTTGTGGFGFIVEVTDGSTNFEVLIDSDISLYNDPAPAGNFNLSGMGSQRTASTSPPFDSGYRIIPCSGDDLDQTIGVEVPEWSVLIEVFPNPASDYLDVRTVGVTLDQITITDVLGRTLLVENSPEQSERINTSQLPVGIYQITFQNAEGTYTEQFVKE